MKVVRLTEGRERGLVNAPLPVVYDERWEYREQTRVRPEELHTVTQPKPEAAQENPPQSFPQRSPFRLALRSFYRAIKFSFKSLGLMIKIGGLYFVRHPLHAFLNIVFLGLLGLMMYTGSEIHQQMILGKISDQTIDRIIDSSRFTRNYDSDELGRSGVREFLRAGAPRWAQREGVRAILFHARRAGLPLEDQAVLLAIADIESGFNPMARAGTTTACGLFQFVRRTGEIFNLSASDCMDPWLNARSGIDHYLYNYRRRIESKVQGLDGAEKLFTTFELSYYLHHDGPDSNNSSNEVKATILSGAQVLFKAYRALREEELRQARAPTFAEQFFETSSRVFDLGWREVTALVQRGEMLIGLRSGESDEAQAA
jgi:Transglycosylase SLT domain